MNLKLLKWIAPSAACRDASLFSLQIQRDICTLDQSTTAFNITSHQNIPLHIMLCFFAALLPQGT